MKQTSSLLYISVFTKREIAALLLSVTCISFSCFTCILILRVELLSFLLPSWQCKVWKMQGIIFGYQ